MLVFMTYAFLIVYVVVLGLTLLVYERRERERDLKITTLESAELLETSLEQRLRAIDDYRHDLAELLQSIDPELMKQLENNDTSHAD